MKVMLPTDRKVLSLFLYACALLPWQKADAEVRLHQLFGNHMVLQRESPVPVWGWADPGEKVSVRFKNETKTTIASADGHWQVLLEPLKTSTAPAELVVQGSNTLKITDVLVGDVWLGTGQSNMDFSVHGTDGAERIRSMPPGVLDGVRLFKVEQAVEDAPVEALAGQWTDATAPHAMGFSATLLFFGEELTRRQPGVPLGLIRSSVGATNAYCWISNEVRDGSPATEYVRQWWAGIMRGWSPERQAARDQEIKDYNTMVEEYRSRHEKLPDHIKKPGEFMGAKWSRRPSGLYNGMIAPIQPFAIRGTIWYQGEWDAKHDWVQHYESTLTAMLSDWRAKWASKSGSPKLGEFAAYIVQLPSRIPGDGDYWPWMREVQSHIAAKLPHSGMITTFDLNDGTDLHPKEKTELGRRLARLALGKEYDSDISWHGPQLKSSHADGHSLVIEFDPGADLMKSSDGQPLRHFEVAGENGVYQPATAELKGNSVTLSADGIEHPLTAHYAWAPAPILPNFVNSEGLPAEAFRTDAQPLPPRK